MSSTKLIEQRRDKLDKASIRRCVPCRTCKCKPVWGAYFLLCPECGQETGYDDPVGNSVREWNRNNKASA